MATTLNFKDIIDVPLWRPSAPLITATAAGSSIAADLRNDATRHPYNYILDSATTLKAYDPITDEWLALGSPALAGTFGAGATSIFHPSQGPRGTITSGNTTTKVVISTALPSAVGVNSLANRGDGVGFRIRIVGNAGGSSGKTEEKTIVANTGGTTPTIWLDSALSFTPASGDAYEILSGRVFLINAGTTAAGIWKYYDIATNSFSGSLSTTNLPATISTDSNGVAFSESYVPNSKTPGQGFLGNLVATGSAAGTITGTAAGGDAALVANQYRNFQIRIVQDTSIPTAAGQRRRISSHTAGASPVYTLASNWTVTPSTNATFVIENFDDRIILQTSASAFVYTYNISGNTWDNSTFTAPASAPGAGVVIEQSFGIDPDVNLNAHHGLIYRIRGGAVSSIDVLDITASSNGTWSAGIIYGNSTSTFTTGTCGVYDPATFGGRFLHINVSGTQRNTRFDMKNRILDPECYIRGVPSTTISGSRLGYSLFIDGATKLAFVHQALATSSLFFSMAITR